MIEKMCDVFAHSMRHCLIDLPALKHGLAFFV